MFPGESHQKRRPTVVTAAFWCQLAVAALLVVLAVVNVVGALMFRHLFGAAALGATPVLLFGLAAWLVGAAFGLRRGSRAAYWLSLTGMTLPLLIMMAVSVFGTDHHVLAGDSSGDAIERANQLAAWAMLSSIVNGLVALPVLGLVAATVGMLATGASRRFFADPGHPGGFAAPSR